MKNYIELNGVNSNEIDGLLIQELPPISLPLMRTQIEEIDGRDGDIITKLGYSAYNKEISIGLYGNFDIDNVISYFTNNQSGQITFSNEPDKYYNYEIIDQIDFERLVKFRTAIVNIHVQPFKYSTIEATKTFEIAENQNSINIVNNGNYVSRPIITITGTGTINLSLNGLQLFIIEMEEEPSITIDTNLMEAYNGTDLLNRSVTGNYENFVLNTGTNEITWSGTITEIQIENYSRWM